MAEATAYLSKKNEADVATAGFIGKFVSLDAKSAQELREKITAMDNVKIRDTHISKIIDTLPEYSEEVNKIFTDVGLDENETKQILDAVAEVK